MAAVQATCNLCGALVDPSRGAPCPNCGRNAGKSIAAVITDRMQITDWASWEQKREFWEVNRAWLVVAISISLASAFVGVLIVGIPGVIVSLLIGLVEFWVGPKAITVVREIRRGGT